MYTEISRAWCREVLFIYGGKNESGKTQQKGQHTPWRSNTGRHSWWRMRMVRSIALCGKYFYIIF